MGKQIIAITSLILGIIFDRFSIEGIFKIIFEEQFKSGNYWALIGLIVALLVGIIFTSNGIAIIAGYKNLGEFLKENG